MLMHQWQTHLQFFLLDKIPPRLSKQRRVDETFQHIPEVSMSFNCLAHSPHLELFSEPVGLGVGTVLYGITYLFKKFITTIRLFEISFVNS